MHSAAPPLHWSGGGQEKLKKFKPKERNMWPDRAKKGGGSRSEVREKNPQVGGVRREISHKYENERCATRKRKKVKICKE